MIETLHLSIKQLDKGIEPPSYAHEGDAGLDLRSTCDCAIGPGQRVMVPCGIAVAIPQGFAGLVIPRSGLAVKHGISIVNAPGLIDSGYRGEIKAILINTDHEESFEIARGDRIAQLVIIETPRVTLEHVNDLPDTQRSESGFGSSGVS